jgi:hypothetical protein
MHVLGLELVMISWSARAPSWMSLPIMKSVWLEAMVWCATRDSLEAYPFATNLKITLISVIWWLVLIFSAPWTLGISKKTPNSVSRCPHFLTKIHSGSIKLGFPRFPKSSWRRQQENAKFSLKMSTLPNKNPFGIYKTRLSKMSTLPLMACSWPSSWEPQEEGMMSTAASLPSVWNQGLSNQ